MSEAGDAAPARGASTAGAILREARQAQGLHIAALAAAIKVSQKKLEALEGDRFDELPDATFTRALAQTVCRSLKIDPAPVLALLPHLAGYRLEHVAEGINAPFRDRPGRHEPKDWASLASPMVWGAMVVVVAAVVMYLLPQGWLAALPSMTSAAPAASAPKTVSEAAAPVTVSEPVPSPPVETAAAPAPVVAITAASEPIAAASAAVAASESPPLAAAAPASGPLQLRAKATSWIEVQDAHSQVLLSRHVQPGEMVVLDGAFPMRVKIGNASATELVFRGQPLDLSPSTRDNVARLELK
jgi:cytoskeleton protein RodZ